MLLWIERNRLRSSLYIALAATFFFGGLDLIAVGPIALLATLILAGGIVAARYYPWLANVAIVLSTVVSFVTTEKPTFSGGVALLIVAITAAFASRMWALITLGVTLIAGLSLMSILVFAVGLQAFGLLSYDYTGAFNVALVGYGLIISTAVLAHLLGRLTITITTHVGTAADRIIATQQHLDLTLLLAEQNSRFEIAKDISELAIQRLTAAVSLADGASFALKGESELAERSLLQISQSARQAHLELRRLYDMLNRVEKINAAPPGIADLNELILQYREVGYNITVKHLGNQIELEEGLELAIYRIVFDALENIRKHVPQGADVTVDFSWTNQGLQVLVKDNGVEVSNRAASVTGYSIEDDKRALVETITGAGLTAMRERAALYGGSIEANRVPGVGFTLSAIFPGLDEQ